MKNTLVGAMPTPIKTSPNRKRFAVCFRWCGPLVVALLCGGLLATASAQTFTNLHSFTVLGISPNSTNSDGASPYAGLVLSGNTLYGTTSTGGTSGNGTVFAVNTDGTGFTNLHSFTATSGFYPYGNGDGASPLDGLILSGNALYGTARAGGSVGSGTLFRINTDGTGFTNLHDFTGGTFPFVEGRNPSGLILSGNTLYGTTATGGSPGNGTVYGVNTDGSGFTNLHTFTASTGHPTYINGDGVRPQAGLILSGNTLYGTAYEGGSSGKGTVFAVNTDGTGFTNLHNFLMGSDGAHPRARLVLSGNTLYGTAQKGGSTGNGTVFSISLPVSPPIMVTNVADSGAGTLRQAILDVNADASPEPLTIAFNIPGAGVQTIAPLTPFPVITRPVTIDGYTQPDASPNTLAQGDNAVLRIELNGTNVTSNYGLRFHANDCTVRGLVINGFAAQVVFESATNGVVEGNFLGTDASGMNTNTVVGANGVLINGGAKHRVGGLTAASRNIVSGNGYVGINVGSCTGLQILGNFIGITADGSGVLPDGWGIYLSACSQSKIGGSVAGARNVIAGGGSSGCWIDAGESNVIQGNFIGTDASGMSRRPNLYGLVLLQSPHNLVGGPGAGEGNLVSGNDTGVYLEGVGASNNVIAGNFIGPDVTGTNALGNTYYGVTIENAPNNTVGGLAPGARNVICGNDYAGVAISYATATGNVIQGNYIGVDVTGTNALGNLSGIFISESPGNLVGGLTPASRNIIGGNQTGISLFVAGVNNQVFGNFIGLGADGLTVVSNSTGIGLHYCYQIQIGGPTPGARNVISGNGGGFHANQGGSNVIQGNFIGTDASGTLPRGNLNGVFLNESSHTLIGGTEAGAGNLISANSGIGLGLQGVNASNIVVAGNLIGTDVSGTNALGNGDYGVYVGGGSGNVIGSDSPGARNVISGSEYAGVAIFYAGATGNVVQGNLIGTDVTGALAVSNRQHGVLIYATSGNLIGGTTVGAGNVIAFSTYAGVSSTENNATNNAVLGNSIFAVGGPGIDLGGDGVTPNDAGDADGSPNHFQNFPEITSAALIGGDVAVSCRVIQQSQTQRIR